MYFLRNLYQVYNFYLVSLKLCLSCSLSHVYVMDALTIVKACLTRTRMSSVIDGMFTHSGIRTLPPSKSTMITSSWEWKIIDLLFYVLINMMVLEFHPISQLPVSKKNFYHKYCYCVLQISSSHYLSTSEDWLLA